VFEIKMIFSVSVYYFSPTDNWSLILFDRTTATQIGIFTSE